MHKHSRAHTSMKHLKLNSVWSSETSVGNKQRFKLIIVKDETTELTTANKMKIMLNVPVLHISNFKICYRLAVSQFRGFISIPIRSQQHDDYFPFRRLLQMGPSIPEKWWILPGPSYPRTHRLLWWTGFQKGNGADKWQDVQGLRTTLQLNLTA